MLKLDGVEFAYGKIRALSGVSFEFFEGEITAIVGSNGAGKSTLMGVISGLLRPQKGTVEYDGAPLPPLPHLAVAAGISLVPEGRRIFPNLNVEENLLMGGYTVKDRSPGLMKAYRMFPRLEERKKQRAGTLSGGEQQMLAIARGLMSNPRLLLLDEPSLGLAPLIVNEVISIIKEINEQNITVLLVEQNIGKALGIAHRACVMEQGRIVKSGSADELREDESIVSAYLGVRE